MFGNVRQKNQESGDTVSLVSFGKKEFQVSSYGILEGFTSCLVNGSSGQERYIDRSDDRTVDAVECFVGAAALQGVVPSKELGKRMKWSSWSERENKSCFSSKERVEGLWLDVGTKGHALASESLGSGDEEWYAVCSGRQLDTKASLLQCESPASALWTSTVDSVEGREDVPGQWTCGYCNALRWWPARKRCYRCGELR